MAMYRSLVDRAEVRLTGGIAIKARYYALYMICYPSLPDEGIDNPKGSKWLENWVLSSIVCSHAQPPGTFGQSVIRLEAVTILLPHIRPDEEDFHVRSAKPVSTTLPRSGCGDTDMLCIRCIRCL
ncbi:hypothetical protein N7G274_006254 [Stereocaulon virgatum]|uniref:Uncharacterized protein n=1 Tax=Stereocaulon virgatum TaxID=373712 RepID=A0ABR4A605_9LECA